VICIWDPARCGAFQITVGECPRGAAYNRMRKPPVAVAVATPEDVVLLREIRDSLKR
jgi:hypothetical protein